MPARKNAKKKEHYVDNKQFLHELIIYRNKCEVAKQKGLPKPRVSNYIGECFLKIATHLSYRPNFINYMYREDMIGDGIENCIQYIHNFNPDKSSNPFAYFTQIIWNAFIRKIEKEKKLLLIKKKYYDHKYVNQELVDYSLSDKTKIPYVDMYIQNDYMDELEKKHDEKNG